MESADSRRGLRPIPHTVHHTNGHHQQNGHAIRRTTLLHLTVIVRHHRADYHTILDNFRTKKEHTLEVTPRFATKIRQKNPLFGQFIWNIQEKVRTFVKFFFKEVTDTKNSIQISGK